MLLAAYFGGSTSIMYPNLKSTIHEFDVGSSGLRYDESLLYGMSRFQHMHVTAALFILRSVHEVLPRDACNQVSSYPSNLHDNAICTGCLPLTESAMGLRPGLN